MAHQLPLHILLARKGKGVQTAGLAILRATARDARLQKDGFGYLAISYAVENGYFPIFRECLAFFALPQLKWRHERTGNSLVHLAAFKRNLEILTHLSVEFHINMNVQNDDGQTPLHIVTTLGDEMMVRMMKSFGADANIVDSFEQTPVSSYILVQVIVSIYQ